MVGGAAGDAEVIDLALVVLGAKARPAVVAQRQATGHGALASMGRSTRREHVLSDNRKYRKFTSKQKVELVLASFRGAWRVGYEGKEVEHAHLDYALVGALRWPRGSVLDLVRRILNGEPGGNWGA